MTLPEGNPSSQGSGNNHSTKTLCLAFCKAEVGGLLWSHVYVGRWEGWGSASWWVALVPERKVPCAELELRG